MNVPDSVDGARPSPDTTIGSVVNAASRSKYAHRLPVAEVEKRHAEIWRAVVARRQVEDPIGIGHRRPRMVWAFTIVKSMLLTPIPSARTATAENAKPGARHNIRIASRRSAAWCRRAASTLVLGIVP